MSGDSSKALFFDTDDLRAEYTGLDEVFLDKSVVTPGGAKFHRPAADDDTHPACQSERAEDWRVVETDRVRSGGFSPCHGCFGPVADHLARLNDSPVERADSAPAVDRSEHLAADGGLDAIAGGDDRLASPTEEVLVAGSGSRYHAPTGDGPLCKVDSELRRVDRAVLAGHYPPCRECFDLDDE